MGVTDPKKHDPQTLRHINSDINVIENYLSPPMVNEVAEDSSQDNMLVEQTAEARSSRPRRLKAGLYKKFLDRSIRAKKRGVRQAKRTENLTYLLSMSEQDEPETDEMDFVDLMEHGLTPFAELFAQQEKMKIWNDFINRSEDEQADILLGSQDNADVEHHESHTNEGVPIQERRDSTGSWEVLSAEDNRSVHPGFSADECFKRIDSRIRLMLKKKHVPLGTLINLEEDVVSFFVEFPSSVYLSHLASSFERMLLHALCQYHNLSSRSFDGADGVRQTQVENNNLEFDPPSVTLSQFIEYRDNIH